MSINLDRVFESLDSFEQDFVEADALARGIPVHEVMAEYIREGLAGDDMDGVFLDTDSQWKSH